MEVEKDDPLEKLTRKELKEECRSNGLSDRGKKSRKRGYGPPAFVCLACNINFMQKEDIFQILLL